MRGRTFCGLVFLLSSYVPSGAETTCVPAASLQHSTVSIARYFDDSERAAQPGLIAVQGTGWFKSPSAIVTVEHVAAAMRLPAQSWTLIEIWDGTERQSIAARIQRRVGGRAEKLVVIELQTAVSSAHCPAIRRSPLAPEDRLVTLAYPGHKPRSVRGRFVQYAHDGRLAGTALLEMYDGNDRLAVDHGASGAPVFDCEGRVAAVISTVITQTFSTPFGRHRISTAWGSPNVVSVPVHELIE
jgi:hypothetical protein